MPKTIKRILESAENKPGREGASGRLVTATKINNSTSAHPNRKEAIRRIADDAEKRLKGSMKLLA